MWETRDGLAELGQTNLGRPKSSNLLEFETLVPMLDQVRMGAMTAPLQNDARCPHTRQSEVGFRTNICASKPSLANFRALGALSRLKCPITALQILGRRRATLDEPM